VAFLKRGTGAVFEPITGGGRREKTATDCIVVIEHRELFVAL
jgi:hypothetical protein